MKTPLFMLILAFGACPVQPSVTPSRQADEPVQIDVYTSGTEGFHTFRIPALLVTRRGTRLAFAEGRKTSAADHGDVDLVLKRSTDGGRSWGPLQLIHEEGGDAPITIGNPCAVVDHSTGTIWLTMNRTNARVLVTSSNDDGATWAEPTDITDQVKRPGWGWYAMGPGVGIQLTRGPHRGRLVIPANHRETPDRAGTSYSHVIYSDDHGRTWKLGGSVGPHTNECQVVELADGTLLINARNHWGRYGDRPDLAPMRVVARSRDGGETWADVGFDKTLIEPNCQASLIRYPREAAEGGDMLLFSNPASKTTRHRLTVRASYNKGRTWPHSKLIYAGPTAYCCLAALPDGNIGLLYERDGSAKITFAQFSLHWLTEE
jgi:sialidase-1